MGTLQMCPEINIHLGPILNKRVLLIKAALYVGLE